MNDFMNEALYMNGDQSATIEGNQVKFMIGIDPGVNTGLAIYDRNAKQLVDLRTCQLHEAFELVAMYQPLIKKVRVEDARKRKMFGNSGREKLQGAGSIKRDCSAWEQFLKAKNIPYEMVAPKDNKTKLSSDYFKLMTGWSGKTSNHARDAGMLVWGF